MIVIGWRNGGLHAFKGWTEILDERKKAKMARKKEETKDEHTATSVMKYHSK